jgi:predicted transcriptional regulator
MAVILKVVIRGEGSSRGNKNGAHLSFSQMKRYLLQLLDTDLLTTNLEKESIYKLTLKATSFSQLYEQLYKTIQYPRK